MKWLPYEIFYITTNLTPDAAKLELEQEVDVDANISFKSLFSFKPYRYFKGHISGFRFQLRSQSNYHNAFRPVINVEIVPNVNGSRMYIKMRLETSIIIGMCLWMSIMSYVCITSLIKRTTEGIDAADFFGPLGMALLVYLIAMAGFKFTSIGAKNKLAQVFPGDIEEA